MPPVTARPRHRLPRGKAYEQWVNQLFGGVCEALGINVDDTSIRRNDRIHGMRQNHEFDIVAEGAGSLILVDCKDHLRLAPKEILDAYDSAIDVAKVRTDRVVTAVVVSRSSIPAAGRRIVEEDTDPFITPPNLLRPARLVTLSRHAVGEAALLYEQQGSECAIHVLRVGHAGRAVTELEEALFNEPDIAERCQVAMALHERDISSGLALAAAAEAAGCLLHLGLADESLWFSNFVEREAASCDSSYFAEIAGVVESMARYQRAVRSRASRRPGLRGVRRLASDLDTMTAVQRSNSSAFVGAWLGQHDDPRLAVPYLERARAEAEHVDGSSGAYLAFLADFRTAELQAGEEREQWLEHAESWLPDVEAGHRILAVELLRRARTGTDGSIRSVFDSPAVRSADDEATQQ